MPHLSSQNCRNSYLFGLFPDGHVLAIEGVSEAAGQLPQWLILRLPIHVGV